MLSQYMARPHDSRFLATKRVLRYLKGSYNYGIEFTDNCDLELEGYSNSYWEERSMIGYLQ